MARSDKYAHVRHLEDEAIALFVLANRQWWRFRLNRKREAQARKLLEQAGREIDLIAARRREFAEAVERRRAP